MSNFNFVIILLIVFVNYIGLGLIYPIFAALLFDTDYPMMAEAASSAYRGAMLGLLIALTPLTQFFSSSILGLLSDTYGRRKTLLCGTAIGCLGYSLALIGIWNHSLLLLCLYRICVGISEGTVAVGQAMIADISTEENKGRRFSLFSASAGIGFMIGPFFGGVLTNPDITGWTGYDIPFIVANIMCFINLLLIFCWFTETRSLQQKKKFNLLEGLNNLRKVLLWPHLTWLFVATFAFAFGWSFFNEFIPILLKEYFMFTPGAIGYYYAYGGAWFAISAGIATAPLLKRFSPEKVVVKASLGCVVSMLLFLAIPNAFYIWLIMPPFMYMLALTFPTTTALASNHAHKDNQGEILGVYQSVHAAAMGLSPLLMGSAIGAYPGLTAWGGALAMAIAAFAFWKICHTKEVVVTG